MPIFDFECDACDHKQERIVKQSEIDSVAVCPSCGLQAFNRAMITKAPHVVYRGPGWTGRIK